MQRFLEVSTRNKGQNIEISYVDVPMHNYATVGCHPETLGLECFRRGKSHDRA